MQVIWANKMQQTQERLFGRRMQNMQSKKSGYTPTINLTLLAYTFIIWLQFFPYISFCATFSTISGV